MEITLLKHGRITLPAVLRERLGLKAGDKIAITKGKNGSIILSPQVKTHREE